MSSNPAQLTPVSLLSHLCITNNTAAEYELVAAVGQSHAPTFTFQVKVNDFTITADGPSKQKAKHAAAKILLEKLLKEEDGFKDGFEFDGTKITAENLHEFILEPTTAAPEEELKGNPVGALQELCMKLKWGAPYYETLDVDGPPHDRTFLLSCAVEGTPFPSEAKAKTKKLAKRLSAENMLQHLNGKSIVEGEGSIDKFIADWKGSKPDLLERLMDLDLKNFDLDFPKALHELSIEKNCDLIFDVNYFPIELQGLEGDYFYALHILELPETIEIEDKTELYRRPVACFICSDPSKLVARNRVARNFLNFFKHKLSEDEPKEDELAEDEHGEDEFDEDDDLL